MSDLPGYPTSFSPWHQLSSARPVFPLGTYPLPIHPTGVSGFSDPGCFHIRPAALPDLLSSLPPPSPYRPLPPISTGYHLASVPGIPGLGLEPLYGCGIQEPRGLLHSPNFPFSQNPSPLTFDQVYRASGSSSVSPVSQYRNQFDQRYVNSRLLVPGRLSEPLVSREARGASVEARGASVGLTRDTFGLSPSEGDRNGSKREIADRSGAKRETADRTGSKREIAAERKDTSKSLKLWKPFESEKVETVKDVEEKRPSVFSIESLTGASKSNTSEKSASETNTSGNDIKTNKSDDDHKVYPRQPIPHYPIKPIALYDSQRRELSSSLSSPVNSHSSVSSFSQSLVSPKRSSDSFINVGESQRHSFPTVQNHETADVSETDGTSKRATSLIHYRPSEFPAPKSATEVSNVVKDFNANSEVEKNCNLIEKKAALPVVSELVKQSGETEKSSSKQEAIPESGADTKKVKVKDEDIEKNEKDSRVTLTGETIVKESKGADFDDKKVDLENIAPDGFNGREKRDESNVIESVNADKCIFQTKLAAKSVPYAPLGYQSNVLTSLNVPDSSEAVPESDIHENTPCPPADGTSNKKRRVSLEVSIQIPNLENSPVKEVKSKLCSPNRRASSESKKSPKAQKAACKNSKLEELTALTSQVNEIRNRRNSYNREGNVPKLLSPVSDIDMPKTHGTDSHNDPAGIVNGESCVTVNGKSCAPVNGNSRCKGIKMASTSAMLMKQSEDSLSASVSSSQISESDSDTQLSTENAEKMFTESHAMNTQSQYPQQSASGRSAGYMPKTNNGSVESQFFKTNHPQMCQSDSDNQKPYMCVPEQTAPQQPLLPQYNCYAPHQSSDVLPSESNFQSNMVGENVGNQNFSQSNPDMSAMDSGMNDYDENSLMSETNTGPDCESHLSLSHGSDSLSGKGTLQDSNGCSNPQSYLGDNEQSFQWDFLHSKQYVDNIYGKQTECEAVKAEEEKLRDTDSPKTFIDLDTTTKEKKAQESFRRDSGPSAKHYGKGYSMRGGYPGSVRHGPNSFGNQMYDQYGNMGPGRWGNYNGSDGSNQSRMSSEGDGSSYEQNQNQFRGNYPYPGMSQTQNGGDKSFVPQPGYHGNDFNHSDSNFFNQNQSGKNYQGNYGNDGRYENNFYPNKGSGDYGSQSNMYPPTSTEMPGTRYGNQGFSGNQTSYGQHYSQQTPALNASNNMGQYQNNTNQNYNLQRSVSSGSSEFGSFEAPVVQKKKRGRKRKVDKEQQDDGKPRPNTIVQASTNLGPLIDLDNPDCPIETYDYNNQIETIFNYNVDDDLSPFGVQLLQMEQRLCQKMLPFKYGHPVNVVYSPLTYAFQTHKDFVMKFCNSERPIVFLGMNPGPYGMSQNGVPFGEATVVRDWLKITGDIYKPDIEHPKKPVTGLACTRNEVSGARFWGLFQKICKIPENFFKNCYVHNFCPLAYMSESGKNITPPQLVHSELDQITEVCDVALVDLVKILNTRIIIAVGKFVQQRASKALHNAGITNVKVECILHPSPINPHANKGWEQIVAKQLIEMNVMHFLNPDMEDVRGCIEEWEKIAATNAKLAE